MQRLTNLVCVGVLASLAGLAVAADKKADKDKPALTGTWTQAGAELQIAFDKDVMKVFPHGDKADIAIVCKYTAAKDGLVKATVSDYEGKEEFKNKIKELVPTGLEFSFKWQVKDDNATLDDVKGDKTDALKSHMEGKYEKK
jgi:hypothetical protein